MTNTASSEFADPVGRLFVDVPLALPGVPENATLEVVEAHWKFALSITKSEVNRRGKTTP